MRGLIAVMALVMGGCEIVVGPTDANVSDAGDVAAPDAMDTTTGMDAPMTCTTAVTRGDACSTPGLECPGPGFVCGAASGNEMCTCVSGAWVCTTHPCSDGGGG